MTYKRRRDLVLARCIWFALVEGLREDWERRGGGEFRPLLVSLLATEVLGEASGLWDAPGDAMHSRSSTFTLWETRVRVARADLAPSMFLHINVYIDMHNSIPLLLSSRETGDYKNISKTWRSSKHTFTYIRVLLTRM